MKRLLTLLVVVAACAVSAVAASAYLRSYNEVSETDDRWTGQTKVGDFKSLKQMGGIPLTLVWTIKTWPNHLSCVIATDHDVLRWADFDGSLSVDVCLTRVLAKSKSVDETIGILRKNGFVSPTRRSQPNIPDEITELAATCLPHADPCSKSFERMGGWFARPHALSVSLIYHQDELLDVSALPLTK